MTATLKNVSTWTQKNAENFSDEQAQLWQNFCILLAALRQEYPGRTFKFDSTMGQQFSLWPDAEITPLMLYRLTQGSISFICVPYPYDEYERQDAVYSIRDALTYNRLDENRWTVFDLAAGKSIPVNENIDLHDHMPEYLNPISLPSDLWNIQL